MIRTFFCDKEYAWFAWGVLFVLIGLTVGQVYMSVLLNEWYRSFFNSFQTKNYDGFVASLFYFTLIASSTIILSTASVYIGQHYTFKWRQSITLDYLSKWISTGTDTIEGASQRIQEDTAKWAKMTYSLGLGFLRAIMTLIAFIPMLWQMGHRMVVPFFPVAGSLVWAALVTSIGGLLFSAWVGRKLPKLEYQNQKTEAIFRKSLVIGEDNKSLIDMELLKMEFCHLRENYFSLFNAYKWFGIWESFYGQVTMIIPFAVAAPSYFGGLISLGGLVQVTNAFTKVHSGFNYFMENWTTVTELQSVIIRLTEFENMLDRK